MPEVIPDGLPYTPQGIECLRLGARRGGEGIGCCAIDVFQGFSNHPAEERPPIPMVEGDSRRAITAGYPDMRQKTVIGTNEEVFLTYLKIGTMSSCPTEDHAFIAVITGEQIESCTGREWLKILKREGFEWVGCTSNSVYSEYHPNHIFMLIRSAGEYMDEDEILQLKKPPSAWLELEEPSSTPEKRFEEIVPKFGVLEEAEETSEEISAPTTLSVYPGS